MGPKQLEKEIEELRKWREEQLYPKVVEMVENEPIVQDSITADSPPILDRP